MMATLILLGLIALMVITIIVMLLMRKGWKKILLTFAGFLVVLILFYLYANKTCGPNAKDVAIMTPQAEAISNYILEHGIPESLGEIPGLPYGLEECKKTLLYKKYRIVGTYEEYYEDTNQTSAQGEVLEETCRFERNNRKYDVHIRFSATYKDILNIDKNNQAIKTFSSNSFRSGKGELVFYNKKTETGLGYYYTFDMQQKKWEYEKYAGVKNYPHIYSTKDDGICNPMRQ